MPNLPPIPVKAKPVIRELPEGVAGFKPGSYILSGRFKNRPAKITRVFSIDGVVKIEFTPIPKGRKKPRIRNLFVTRLMPIEKIPEAKAMEAEEAAKIRARKHAATKVAARFEALNVPAAMDTLKEAVHIDEGYLYGWHDNLAMAAVDEGVDRKVANIIAKRFLKALFDVDSKVPEERG